MNCATETVPKYSFKTGQITVRASGVTYNWSREIAESLFESLRVALYEASLYDSYLKKKRDNAEELEGSAPVEDI